MENFDVKELLPFLFLIVGMALFLYAMFSESKTDSIKLTGEKVEGTVFELEHTSSSTIKVKVTVRFVTKKKEWITAEIKQDFALFFHGQYRIGEKVVVYYEVEDPGNFMVDTKQSETGGRVIGALAGLFFIVFALYRLFGAD